MANLTWSNEDGFDPEGRRVAAVVKASEPMGVAVSGGEGSGPGILVPRRRYWEAFVADDGGRFEHVIVDGRPGRWATREEAKAAAESAHRTLAESGEAHTQAAHGERVADQDRQPTGVFGHLRSIVRAWRVVHRSGR